MGDPEEQDIIELTPEGVEVAEALIEEGFTPEEAVEILAENDPELDVERSFETGDVGDE